MNELNPSVHPRAPRTGTRTSREGWQDWGSTDRQSRRQSLSEESQRVHGAPNTPQDTTEAVASDTRDYTSISMEMNMFTCVYSAPSLVSIVHRHLYL